MKKIQLLSLALVASLSLSAENTTKLRVWIGGTKAEYPLTLVDSLTFFSEAGEEPLPEPDPTPTPAEGIGVFTVAEGKTVAFASGNLQYNAAQGSHYCANGSVQQGTWRFAEHQYDYIGDANSNISKTYDGWIDLFGWGTSGYDNTAKDPSALRYQPWEIAESSVSTVPIDSVLNCEKVEITGECEWEYTAYMDATYNYYGYGPSTNMPDPNLTGTSANYDWGVYNAISNAGNQAGQWRTLSVEEWDYLFNTRENAQFLWSRSTVNGVRGMIILPDDFQKPSDISWTYQANNYTNTYTTEQWATLEALGAVFLPAAGGRWNTDVSDMQLNGYYWSSSYYTICQPYALCFAFSYLDTQFDFTHHYDGYSVRLVQDL